MKKFSRTTVFGLTALASLALAACSPPGEVDSDVKVDNASTFTNTTSTSSARATTTSAEPTATASATAGAEQVAFIDCVSIPTVEPASITLDCVNNQDVISNIEWTSWDDTTAQGTGSRANAAGRTVDADIVLSQPAVTTEGVVFTQIEVDGDVVTR
ncbi:MAG: hypothetical protein SOW59_03140 [Corynebacterium sp.]|nr:hypothetical protein [Corynebacterium sp.]